MSIGLCMCRGQWGESEWALKVMTRRRVVEVDRVDVEVVVAVGCSRVDVLVDFVGIEWGVVVIAGGEGDDVIGRWL